MRVKKKPKKKSLKRWTEDYKKLMAEWEKGEHLTPTEYNIKYVPDYIRRSIRDLKAKPAKPLRQQRDEERIRHTRPKRP